MSWFSYANCRSKFYFDILITIICSNVIHKNWFFSFYYAVFSYRRLLFQPHFYFSFFCSTQSFTNLSNMLLLLHIIMTYIKENISTKSQKLYSFPRNLPVGNKLTMLFVKKLLCTSNLPPVCKMFIEWPGKWCIWVILEAKTYS